jgi:hypothetical protein
MLHVWFLFALWSVRSTSRSQIPSAMRACAGCALRIPSPRCRLSQRTCRKVETSRMAKVSRFFFLNFKKLNFLCRNSDVFPWNFSWTPRPNIFTRGASTYPFHTRFYFDCMKLVPLLLDPPLEVLDPPMLPVYPCSYYPFELIHAHGSGRIAGKPKQALNSKRQEHLNLNYRIRVGDGEATLVKTFDFPFYP